MDGMRDRRSPLPPPQGDEPEEQVADQEDQNGQEDEDDEGMDEEFLTLDSQLDQISSVLDVLEQKNDRLQIQLRQLLASSRQERELIAIGDDLDEPPENSDEDPAVPPPESMEHSGQT